MPHKSFVIRYSTDYRAFRRNDDNRLLNLKKHRKLEASMKKRGFLPYWPAVVGKVSDGAREIYDGQHRAAIAENLQLGIWFVEVDDPSKINIPEINDTQRVWSVADYAEVYSANGHADYQEGIDFYKQNAIPITVGFALLAGTTTYSNIEQAYKSGRFKVKDRDWADRVVSLYNPIVAMSPAIKNTRFLEACMSVCRVEEFSINRMIDGADKGRDKLLPYSTRDAYLSMMEDVYNFRRRELFPLKIKAAIAMRERGATKATARRKARRQFEEQMQEA